MNSGVVAFRIEARPEAICVWPQKIRPKGTRLLSSAHRDEAAPRRAGPDEGTTGHDQHDVERERGEGHAAEHDRERLQLGQRHLGEEERAAPQDGQRQQPDPDTRAHRRNLMAARGGFYPAAASNRRRVSAGPRIATTSKMPGETIEPDRSTRSGCATWPRFTTCTSAKRRAPLLLTLDLHLCPGVPQLDRAVEHQSLRPAREVRAEIAQPLELHGFPCRCLCQ